MTNNNQSEEVERIVDKVLSDIVAYALGTTNWEANLDPIRESITTHGASEYARGKREESGDWYLGKKIKAFGGDYIVVGISQMVYDEDCEGEPEWKNTKEVQEVAIAKEFDEISYQKPSWHKVQALSQENTLKE